MSPHMAPVYLRIRYPPALVIHHAALALVNHHAAPLRAGFIHMYAVDPEFFVYFCFLIPTILVVIAYNEEHELATFIVLALYLIQPNFDIFFLETNSAMFRLIQNALVLILWVYFATSLQLDMVHVISFMFVVYASCKCVNASYRLYWNK